jgi:hypothetical protein
VSVSGADVVVVVVVVVVLVVVVVAAGGCLPCVALAFDWFVLVDPSCALPRDCVDCVGSDVCVEPVA